MKGRMWKSGELRALRSGYDDPELSVNDIADVLQRSRDSVACMAHRLGLAKATFEVPPPESS